MGEFSYRQLGRPGFAAEAERVRAARAEGGPEKATAAVPPARMAPVGFRVCSTEACSERLEREEEAGARLHSATVLEDDPREAAKILARLVG